MVEGKTVFESIPILEWSGTIPSTLTAFTCDSRQVEAGSLFVALRGSTADGHAYLHAAAQRGAVAVVVETFDPTLSLPQARVADTLAVLPRLAANFYGHPADSLSLIGITGSNGKTTTTYLLESIWRSHQEGMGVIGTIEYRFGNTVIEATNTTPLPHDLQHLLRQMAEAGIHWVAMEVSSHGLALHRVEGIQFSIALFTNLTQDHLDFHKTMAHYRDSKKRLFTEHLQPGGVAICNADDETGRQFFQELQKGNRLSFGIDQPADCTARAIDIQLTGMHFILHLPDGREAQIQTRLVGRHNISNILGAAAIAWAAHIPFETIVKGIESFERVPGRLEPVPNSLGAQILVDYCHTPDALEKCLQTLEAIPHTRLLTLVGCGGDRDPFKRPLMGAIAQRYSDWVILTSDNPRTEDPLRIIQDIQQGLDPHQSNVEIIPDRKQAIHAGIARLEANDIFLIAGKGHETYQIIGRQKVPFDDRSIAHDALQARSGGAH
ncbi:MAG: UDP-N-acetylmuramoyl-L-alanyl-D-glutamate--2,6-diaminopimelate ligase [bacterium]|jgi:UDP-N-acetylmuramoyl-L-alanyl-D-glutamate--2,6-diaminopimelate ligase|nr:UDP-N-acetylmuramoyl-L-alanyl-D-glutamate--2,6-diaminopimelate ligase [bacterium]